VKRSAVDPQFGFKLPNIGGVMCPPEWATPETVERLAREATTRGFESLWLQDHVVTPMEMEELTDPPFLDPFTVAVRLAALLPAVKIGVATYVLPFRDPVVLAKQLATANRFFPRRFIVGVGAGRYESEFERFGSDHFEDRGKVVQEHMALMRDLFTDDRVTYSGPYRTVREAEMYPKPAPGDLPIWLHGSGPLGIKRAARHADGWIAGSPLVPEFITAVDAFRKARPADRSEDSPIAVSLRVDRSSEGGRSDATDHGFVHRGRAEDVARTLGEFVAAGVTHVLLTFPARTVDELVAKMDWFASEVRPQIRTKSAQPTRMV
jgi:alkanesulfonate monooxygenase SsuD/methylene tetrahydromethanopterin reductase-like flavin-dependent oxidoreductase (luciferase family)